MNIDERLEELALAKGGREYVLTRTLIAALLRARRVLEGCVITFGDGGERHMRGCSRRWGEVITSAEDISHCSPHCVAALAALADNELEEAIK